MHEGIVIPRHVLPDLLTALHIKLEHPTSRQLKQVVSCYLFASYLDQSIGHTVNSCHQYATLKQFPRMFVEQSTYHSPETVGTNFAADVIRCQRQFILVFRESVTPFTSGCFVDSERHATVRESLLCLFAVLCPPDGPNGTIRTDSAPGFQALAEGTSLQQHGIVIDLGCTKNRNKNPVAEKAVQELKAEILHQDPSSDPVSPINLALAVSRLNSRIRGRGLFAYEMWFQHDQFTNLQLHLLDQQLIADQQFLHKQNHPHSKSLKNPKGCLPKNSLVIPGDIVYLYADKDSSRARSHYLVSAVGGEFGINRKFVGSQLRNVTYRVKRNECYAVAPDDNLFDSVEDHDCNDYNSDDCDPQQEVCTPAKQV